MKYRTKAGVLLENDYLPHDGNWDGTPCLWPSALNDLDECTVCNRLTITGILGHVIDAPARPLCETCFVAMTGEQVLVLRFLLEPK